VSEIIRYFQSKNQPLPTIYVDGTLHAITGLQGQAACLPSLPKIIHTVTNLCLCLSGHQKYPCKV